MELFLSKCSFLLEIVRLITTMYSHINTKCTKLNERIHFIYVNLCHRLYFLSGWAVLKISVL